MLHKSNTHGRCVNITSFVCEEIFLVLFMVTILYFLRVSDDSKAYFYFYMINNTYVVILASCLSPNLNCSFINLIGKWNSNCGFSGCDQVSFLVSQTIFSGLNGWEACMVPSSNLKRTCLFNGLQFLIFWWGLGQVGHEIAIPSYTSNKKGIGFTHSYTNIHYEIANVLFFVFFLPCFC